MPLATMSLAHIIASGIFSAESTICLRRSKSYSIGIRLKHAYSSPELPEMLLTAALNPLHLSLMLLQLSGSPAKASSAAPLLIRLEVISYTVLKLLVSITSLNI